MKSIDLLEAMGSIRDKYILEAHSQNASQKKHIPSRRLFLVAAVIALMLLLVGCVAVILGLRGMHIGQHTQDLGNGYTQVSDVISMQGYVGSPEYQAAKEWRDYLESYDPEGTILEEVGNNPTNLDSKYTLYQVYTQEMCDRLEEIAQKYGMALHSQFHDVAPEELDRRVGGSFMSGGLSRGWGYIYDNGTFQFDGTAQIGGAEVTFQFRRAVKGVLDEVPLTIGNIEGYEETQYLTPSGETVILALSPWKGLIIADFEECFITVNVLDTADGELTAEHLQYIADNLDFSMVKDVKKPEMQEAPLPPPEESTQAPSALSDTWPEAKAKFEAILSGEESFFNRDQAEGMTLSQYCESFGTAAEVDFKITQYALSDLDHDGTPELVLWENINGVDDCGFLVIRYDGNGGALGYEFSYRGLIDLKYDGTFGYSGGVANSGYATLVFNEKGWEYDIFGCVEESGEEVTFRWGGSPVSQDEYWRFADMQTAKEPVQWMPYPAEHYDLSYEN